MGEHGYHLNGMSFVLLIIFLWELEERPVASYFTFIILINIFFRYFLSMGYAVIFLYREESLKPFSRKYHHQLFDHLRIDDNGTVKGIYSICFKKLAFS